MSKNIQNNIQLLLDKHIINIVKDKYEAVYLVVSFQTGIIRVFPLSSKEGTIALKKVYREQFNEILTAQEVQYVVELIEIIGTDDVEQVEICKRIFNNGGQYAYELNQEGKAVWIEDGIATTGNVEGILFKHSANFSNQTEPNLKIEPKRLLHYVRVHFNFRSEMEVKLFTLYLVTSFWGLNINHPILVITGEKGSSKSTTMRKLEELIDPKNSVGGGIPKGADGLEIRLSNSYLLVLDNLSSLSRKVSDTLAVAATGGSVTKRALYKNIDEIVLDLKAVIAINGVSLVAKESDLLDRSLIITLKRLAPKEIRTEEELWNEFENDKPDILGCCFKTLAVALNDEEPVKTQELIRMADFHVACIKVGRALGISEREVSEILWQNQSNVNKCTLDEDTVALCVIELMKKRTLYTNSVSGLLCDLQDIVYDNGMTSMVLPKTPNHLSNRLSKVKSNLQSEYGIRYTIKNKGTFKEIQIKKK